MHRTRGLTTSPSTRSVAEGQPGSSCPRALPSLAIPAQTASHVVPERSAGRVVGVCSLMLTICPGAWRGAPMARLCWAWTSASNTTSPSCVANSDFVQIIWESLSAWWLILDLPRQAAGWQKPLQLRGRGRSLCGGTGRSAWTCLTSLCLLRCWISCRKREEWGRHGWLRPPLVFLNQCSSPVLVVSTWPREHQGLAADAGVASGPSTPSLPRYHSWVGADASPAGRSPFSSFGNDLHFQKKRQTSVKGVEL